MAQSIKKFQTRIGEIWLDPEGILHGVITKPNAHQTIHDAIEIIDTIKKISEGQQYALLSDVRNIASADRDARNYLARKENAPLIRANAVLIDSLISKVVVNFYLRINKPSFPIQIFTSEDQAMQWLRGFYESNHE